MARRCASALGVVAVPPQISALLTPEQLLPAATVAALRRRLRAYYRAHRRDLPWRRSRDPYAIWVSEIMLQQTQVDTVVPRYEAFLRRFPSVQAMAAAGEQKICEAWAGLGYYRRARLMHQAALQLVAQGSTTLPAAVAALRALPGIGAYTAGAIASIAFSLPAALVDGNVERLLSRHFALSAPPRSGAGKRLLWGLAERLQSRHAPGELNQALMEVGAMICRPRQPLCGRCPWQRSCRAYAEGEPHAYPTAVAKAPRQKLFVAYAWAVDGDAVWLTRRPRAALWGGLWELPSAQGASAALARAALQARVGPTKQLLGELPHTLTHREVRAQIFAVAAPVQAPDEAWRRSAQPLHAPLHTLARKAIGLVLARARLGEAA